MYGDAGSYGGLAGFSGPALVGVDAPVVRYQDLMRTSAPASAGVPEFGRIVQDEPQGFGAEPLPLPVLGGYGAPLAFKDTDGQYEYTIDPSTQPYAVVITKAPSGTFPRTVTPESNKKAYDAIVEQAKTYNPYWFANAPASQTTEREQAEQAEKKAAEDEKKGGKKRSAAEEFLIGAGKRAGFITSGKEEAPKQEVKKDDDQTGTDWGQIVLIGGGVLVGITSIVLITRALTSKE